MNYSVVIRTLGQSGDKFKSTIESAINQSFKPDKIFVYIADGYPLPSQRTKNEEYIYVPKGMVRQRALDYAEVTSEYILFLDDDVYLPENAIEYLYDNLCAYNADLIAPDTFPNFKRNAMTKFKMALIGKSVARKDDMWAYKAMRNGGYSYNENPSKPIYISQLNAGPCFFCRKETFLSIHLEDELWLDESPYALPEDQVMFYKFYRYGYKILTSFDSGIVHLDAGSTNKTSSTKEHNILYSESRNKLIYWHRFYYRPEYNSIYLRILNILSISTTYFIRLLLLLCKLRFQEAKFWFKGIKHAISFINSDEYKALPLIPINKTCYE